MPGRDAKKDSEKLTRLLISNKPRTRFFLRIHDMTASATYIDLDLQDAIFSASEAGDVYAHIVSQSSNVHAVCLDIFLSFLDFGFSSFLFVSVIVASFRSSIQIIWLRRNVPYIMDVWCSVSRYEGDDTTVTTT